jgi:hypothetical protein
MEFRMLSILSILGYTKMIGIKILITIIYYKVTIKSISKVIKLTNTNLCKCNKLYKIIN